MPFVFNGTNIDAINFNGTALDKLVVNGVTVWESFVNFITSGVGRTVVEASQATYPSTTQVTLSPDEGDDDGDGAIPGYCTVRYNKTIPGNGKKLYVQTNMTSDYYAGLTGCTYKVQLVNASTGATLTLGQYAYDWNTTIVDGVSVDAALFNSVNNVLTAYQLPTDSYNYYVQFRFYASDDQSQNMTFTTVQCYTGN